MDTNLLGVEDYLLELARLCETLDDLVGDVGPQVDAEGQCGVHRLHQVPQLLRALQLHTHTHTHTHTHKEIILYLREKEMLSNVTSYSLYFKY